MLDNQPGLAAAVGAVREYLSSDGDRCQPTCRVGCPCDGGMEDAATGAPDAAQEIVDITMRHLTAPRCSHCQGLMEPAGSLLACATCGANRPRDVAYLPCLLAHEAAYWEARRQGMHLTDRQVGDLLRVVAPFLAAGRTKEAT